MIVNDRASEEVVQSKVPAQSEVFSEDDKYQTTDFSAADSDNSPSDISEATQIHEAATNISVECGTQTEHSCNTAVPNWLVPSLIENVRCNTQLSFGNSKTAINVVINTFVDALPHLNSIWCQLTEHLDKLEVAQVSVISVFYCVFSVIYSCQANFRYILS